MPEILSIGELLDLGNSANMSAYIPYSGLEYNASGAISGISGSAIAGGIESSVVSSIVSSMVSGKADKSAVEDCCSAMSAEVSAKLDATASSLFQPSGNYQPSGDYYSATNPSGFITTADLTDYAKESALSSKLDASASSNFAPSGDYVFESSYSSFTSEVTNNITSISSTVSGLTGDYLEKSASSMFAPSGEYAYESSLSSYIPESASGKFAPSGDYADASSLSSYIPYSSVAGDDSQITSINGSAIGGTGSEFTGVVTDDTLTGNGLPDSALGVDNYNVLFDSSLYSSLDGNNVTIGVQSGIYATTGYVDSSVSGKQDTLTFAYDVDKISAINGSALAGGGGATGDYYEKSATEIAYGPSATASQSSLSIGLASSNYGSIAINATNFSVADSAVADGESVAVGQRCTAKSQSLSLGRNCSATAIGIAVGDTAVAVGGSLAFGYDVTAKSLSIAAGLGVTAIQTATAFGKYNLCGNGNTSTGNSAAFVIGDGAYNARHDLMLVTKDGEITMYSGTADTVGTGIMSSIRALSANAGGVDSATVSAIASSYAESAASSKMDSSAIQFVAGSSDATANGVLYILTGNS